MKLRPGGYSYHKNLFFRSSSLRQSKKTLGTLFWLMMEIFKR